MNLCSASSSCPTRKRISKARTKTQMNIAACSWWTKSLPILFIYPIRRIEKSYWFPVTGDRQPLHRRYSFQYHVNLLLRIVSRNSHSRYTSSFQQSQNFNGMDGIEVSIP